MQRRLPNPNRTRKLDGKAQTTGFVYDENRPPPPFEPQPISTGTSRTGIAVTWL